MLNFALPCQMIDNTANNINRINDLMMLKQAKFPLIHNID